MIKNRKMLIEFLKSTLNTVDVSASTNEDAYMMGPNHQQVLRTPENPQRAKTKKKPLTFEQSYSRHLSFTSLTNLNGTYQ